MTMAVYAPDGQVVFRLFDQDETIQEKLGASTTGSGLVLLNERTEPGIQRLTDQNDTRITLVGKAGTRQVIKP